jgi:hypothetical protein
MTRLSLSLGVLLAVSAGVAATVAAQTFDRNQPTPKMPPVVTTAPPPPTAGHTPVFEYEIRIWKDGTPVTPTMKLRARSGETSQVTIAEGTVDLRFEQRSGDAGAMVAPPPAATGASAFWHDYAGAGAQRNTDLALDALKQAQSADQKVLRWVYRTPPPAGQNQSEDAAHAVARKQAAGENKDHEARLAEIERKLERILSALDRLPAKTPGASNDDAKRP